MKIRVVTTGDEETVFDRVRSISFETGNGYELRIVTNGEIFNTTVKSDYVKAIYIEDSLA